MINCSLAACGIWDQAEPTGTQGGRGLQGPAAAIAFAGFWLHRRGYPSALAGSVRTPCWDLKKANLVLSDGTKCLSALWAYTALLQILYTCSCYRPNYSASTELRSSFQFRSRLPLPAGLKSSYADWDELCIFASEHPSLATVIHSIIKKPQNELLTLLYYGRTSNVSSAHQLCMLLFSLAHSL